MIMLHCCLKRTWDWAFEHHEGNPHGQSGDDGVTAGNGKKHLACARTLNYKGHTYTVGIGFASMVGGSTSEECAAALGGST